MKRPNASVGAAVGTASTNFLVDGVPNVTAKTAEPRSDIPQAGVREFAVHTSQQPAQYGWRPGGTVSIVTKSGTNAFTRRSVRVLPQPGDEPLSTSSRRRRWMHGERRSRATAATSGAARSECPIVRNKLHFFGTYERTDEHSVFHRERASAVSTALQRRASAGGFAQNLEMFRLDYQVTPNQNVMFRYLNEAHRSSIASGCGGAASNFSGGRRIHLPRYTSAGTHHRGSSTATWSNEVNWQWARQTDTTRDEQGFHAGEPATRRHRAWRRHALAARALYVPQRLPMGLRGVSPSVSDRTRARRRRSRTLTRRCRSARAVTTTSSAARTATTRRTKTPRRTRSAPGRSASISDFQPGLIQTSTSTG